MAIAEWIQERGESAGKSFTDLLWHITWLRNDKGKTAKYLYFNDHTQKLYLDRNFRDWADQMLAEQQAVLTHINA